MNTEIIDGTPVFSGTRVPVKMLLEYLHNRKTVEDFVEDYSEITNEQAVEASQITDLLKKLINP